MIKDSKETKLRSVKYAPPPPELPVYGFLDPSRITYIGRTNYVAALEEKKFVFGIKRSDRRNNVYMVGKSGVGKSKLLELMIRQDIAYGYGVCLIDENGDLIKSILNFIPEERIGDVCLIDPSDAEFPVAFNPLSKIDQFSKHQLAQSFIEIMEKQFSPNWTPRLEHLFRFVCLALLDYPEATMADMIPILTDEEFRKKISSFIKDEMVKRFWSEEFTGWSGKFEDDAIIPLINKLWQFLSNPILGNIFSQKDNKIDIYDLIKENKIVLVSLAKSRLGESNAGFFGSVVAAKIKQAGMMRASAGKEHKEFYLYFDEFQDFITETLRTLVAESRKYGFPVTLVHQYLGQLPPNLQSAILGNVGHLIVFRVGGEDAERLETEMTPVFKAKDMVNLATQEFYIKTTIDGEAYDPFSAEALNVLATGQSFSERIVKESREKYSINRKT